jgi:hypothetical protein
MEVVIRMKLSERVRNSPPVIYINHYAGEGGQWFLKRHGTKYVRADLAQPPLDHPHQRDQTGEG